MLTNRPVGGKLVSSHKFVTSARRKGGSEMEGTVGIRGIVYDKYKSISAFADAIGWTRQKATLIVNGNQEPNLDDVDKMSKALNLDYERTARFFLPS